MPRPLFPVAVNIAIEDQSDRLLFHRRTNTGYCDGQLAFFGGHVEAHESSMDACVRELMEESTLHLPRERFSFDLLMHKLDVDGQNRFDLFFRVRVSEHEKTLIGIGEPHKCSELIWLNASEISVDQIVPYVAHYSAHRKKAQGGLMFFGFDNGSRQTADPMVVEKGLEAETCPHQNSPAARTRRS